MMALNTKDMVGTPVVTSLGAFLGKVASFDFDADTGRMMSLRIKRGLVAGVVVGEHIVPREAIVELSLERVVVKDATVFVAPVLVQDAS